MYCVPRTIPSPSRCIPNIPPFASLTPNRGCISAAPEPALPNYDFTSEEPSPINVVLENPPVLMSHSPPHSLLPTLERLGCVACHSRANIGGPDSIAKARFVADDLAELGDEGRLPPDLSAVGNKLRLSALREVLSEGTKIRPYMKTRMPKFGAEQVKILLCTSLRLMRKMLPTSSHPSLKPRPDRASPTGLMA